MNERIGIGIIGCGSVAEWKYAENLAAMPGVSLQAFHGGRAAAFQERFGGVVCRTLEELLARSDVDAVCVCTPNSSHAVISVAALQAGKHVLCEKPMAIRTADAERMVEAAHASGRILTVGHQARFSPAAQALYRKLRDGRFGRLYFARASMIRRLGIPTWGHFFDAEVQGGGCLIDLGTHAIDLALWMLDNFSPEYCIGTVFHNSVDIPTKANRWGTWNPSDLQVETAAFGQVVLQGGAVLSIDTSWAMHVPQDKEDALTICGTASGAELFPGGYTVSSVKNDQFCTLRFDTPDDEQIANKAQLTDFITAIRTGGMPLVTADQSLAVVRILDGLYQSAMQKKPYYFS